MSSIGTSGVKSSFDAFSKVDEIVSKTVLGSDGAASWQEFRKDVKTSRPSAAPKAPLKKSDRLGTGFTCWEEERAHEDSVRQQAGQVASGSGYTTFKKKHSAEEAAERKRIKQVEARIRPEDADYFITANKFQGWKFDYIFTTREGRGTGYFWDGNDSIKKVQGKLKTEEKHTMETDDEAAPERKKETKPRKKKRKENVGPTIISDPNNPMEQVAAIIQKRMQAVGTQDPNLPGSWEAARDPSSGRTYYYNRESQERSWERPQPQNQANDDKTKSVGALPNGWQKAPDKETGKIYYYHENGETRWSKPVV